jgi:hypothetical protein
MTDQSGSVWLVWRCGYIPEADQWQLVGVYASRAAAEAAEKDLWAVGVHCYSEDHPVRSGNVRATGNGAGNAPGGLNDTPDESTSTS